MFVTCNSLFYMTYHRTCSPFYAGQIHVFEYDLIDTEIYKHGERYSLINDLVADFGHEPLDEMELVSLLLFNNKKSCYHPSELPCIEGHSKCYNITDICTYQLNLNGHLFPCRNGNHLQNCKKFECNLMFKCTSSFCIPWSYINDGKWDCPNGEDESKFHYCDGMYKCRYSRKNMYSIRLCM